MVPVPDLPRVAAFRLDATPPRGEPLIWDVPLVEVVDPLWAKGVVLEDPDGERSVICAIDWCEIGNATHLSFRERMASAAGTDPSRVALQCVHQHAAPYADAAAHRILDAAPSPPLHLSDGFLADLGARLAAAVAGAIGRLETFDEVGVSEVPVERIASARRLPGPDGKIVVRFSAGAKDPRLAAAPEGDIDPILRTATLASGGRPIVRLHAYATHPQTFCCDGRASADFVGAAREAMERMEGIPQIYLTGCAGDVTAGKYNDGSPAARTELAARLLAALAAVPAATRYEPAGPILWRVAPVPLPARTDPGYAPADLRRRILDAKGAPGSRIYSGAMALAFVERIGRPVHACALELGPALLLFLPGEPMLEFGRFARSLRPDGLVMAVGYGDCGPGYICTDRAYLEGGYEPTATNAGPGSEAALKKSIRVLAGDPR